jgi:hypothetical protein
MSFQGQKNIYLCDHCGHGFVTLDIDKGTTPFMMSCMNCKELASSLCYAAPQRLLAKVKPALEWYRPGEADLAGLTATTRDHVAAGGLISRKAGEK